MTLSTNNIPARPAVFPVVATAAQSHVHADAKSRGFTQGHAAGYAAGLQLAGREAAAARLQQDAAHEALVDELQARNAAQVAALRLAAAALAQRTAPVLADAEQALFSHALELAEALLGHELHDGESTARAALARALGGGSADVPVSIRMHPADLAELSGATLEAMGLPAAVQLAADSSLDRGDAVADYPHGFLDARLGTAVARVRTALLTGHMPAHAGSDNP